jgi:LemA protein
MGFLAFIIIVLLFLAYLFIEAGILGPGFWLLLITFIIIVLAYLTETYNNLISIVNRCDEAWGWIDIQLKRRYDLIPNLVETVKGYAKHEKELLEKVTQARTTAIEAQGVDEQAKAENILSHTLRSIFALSENYPTLKASENFIKLHDEIVNTENKIEGARHFYNINVMSYNTAIQKFPTLLVANFLGFKPKKYFELDELVVRKPVKFQT